MGRAVLLPFCLPSGQLDLSPSTLLPYKVRGIDSSFARAIGIVERT
jgi:hypothetical protein